MRKKLRCAKIYLKHLFVFTFRERGLERAGGTALQGMRACEEVNLHQCGNSRAGCSMREGELGAEEGSKAGTAL